MSKLPSSTRIASSLAIAFTAAALAACGGGSQEAASTETVAAATTSASVTSTSSAASAVEEAAVTTNAAGVAAATDEGTSATTAVSTATTTASELVSPAAASAAVSLAGGAVNGGPATTVVEPGTATATTPSSSTTPVGGAAATEAFVSRPAGNTGTGFYVVGAKLYDPKGHEFRIRGVNHTHWDNGSPGIPLSGANAERMPVNFAKPASANLAIMNTQMVANKIVPIPGNWLGTCKSDVATLSTIVDTWVAQAATWTTLNSTGLINIANEWGPQDSAVWRDGYINAVARMRAAGYTGTLVVDTGGCGQNGADVVKYGAAVLAADPQKNILFDVHVYGSWHLPATATWMQDYTKTMTQLKATGLPMILGEFGPGRNVGPSPTMITPEQVIATAEAAGWGWMPWSWDDNDLPNCMSDDHWFSMTVNCGKYKTTADLTAFGKAIVPIIQSTAVKATSFN